MTYLGLDDLLVTGLLTWDWMTKHGTGRLTRDLTTYLGLDDLLGTGRLNMVLDVLLGTG